MGLREQVFGMIEACEKVLETVAKGKEAEANQHADNQTIQIASKIIRQAQDENKNDAVLAAVKLTNMYVTWTSLLAAMRVVYNSLPEDKAKI